MFFVWLYVVMEVALASPADAGSLESPRTLCGRALAGALKLYCVDADGPIMQKRQVPDLLMEREAYKEKLWTWKPLQGRLAQALPSRDKRMPDLVEECCLKPCSLSELLSYC